MEEALGACSRDLDPKAAGTAIAILCPQSRIELLSSVSGWWVNASDDLPEKYSRFTPSREVLDGK